MLFMFNINVYLLSWKGYLDFITDFITDFMVYFWILLLVCSIIIYFKLERYFLLFSYMEMYFFIVVEELEINFESENWYKLVDLIIAYYSWYIDIEIKKEYN